MKINKLIDVVIPTVPGREEYLKRCLRGYRERTGPGIQCQFWVIHNKATCGIAWQQGADYATGLERLSDIENYLHFTADDIVPGEDWAEPLIEAVDNDEVPVAGVITCTEEVLDPEDNFFPRPGNPRRQSHFQLFEDPDPRWTVGGIEAPQSDSYYPSIPFCSFQQWEKIGPMIPTHYGTDKWFGHRAKQAGYWPVTTPESVFYHYVAQAGRIPKEEGWYHLDRLNFDMNIAYPDYVGGKVPLDSSGLIYENHPLTGTAEGRNAARTWYAQHCGPPLYWQQPA